MWRKIFIFVYIIQLCQLSVSSGTNNENKNECWFGHYWEERSKQCKKCKIGFYGKNCSLICLYPNYGTECQNRCNCDREFCSPFTGCVNPTADSFRLQSTPHYVLEHTTNDSQEKSSVKIEMNEDLKMTLFQKSLLGVLGIIAVFIIVFSIYIALQIKNNCHEKQIKAVRREQNSGKEIQKSESYESLQSVNMIEIDQAKSEKETFRENSASLNQSNLEQTDHTLTENCQKTIDVLPCSDRSGNKEDDTVKTCSMHDTYITVIEG